MPQLTVRGIEAHVIQVVSEELIQELAELCQCGMDNFTIDILQTVNVYGGSNGDSYPFVEIAWFNRGQELQDRMAEIVARHLQQAGVAEFEIAFKVYREDSYYIGSIPCSRL